MTTKSIFYLLAAFALTALTPQAYAAAAAAAAAPQTHERGMMEAKQREVKERESKRETAKPVLQCPVCMNECTEADNAAPGCPLKEGGTVMHPVCKGCMLACMKEVSFHEQMKCNFCQHIYTHAELKHIVGKIGSEFDLAEIYEMYRKRSAESAARGDVVGEVGAVGGLAARRAIVAILEAEFNRPRRRGMGNGNMIRLHQRVAFENEFGQIEELDTDDQVNVEMIENRTRGIRLYQAQRDKANNYRYTGTLLAATVLMGTGLAAMEEGSSMTVDTLCTGAGKGLLAGVALRTSAEVAWFLFDKCRDGIDAVRAWRHRAELRRLVQAAQARHDD